jgi:hypothetical protein
MDIDTTTILSILIIIILSITTIFFISEQIFCKQSLSNLQVKYEQDTTPIKLQISNLKTDIFNLQTEKTQLKDNLSKREVRNSLLERNVLGKFDKGDLIAKNGDCIGIADTTKGDLSFLQVKNTKKCNSIFSYDPNYKQLNVQVGTTTKCIDAFNENDIVLNDCIKNSQKQKFDYYPFFNDGKLYSGLYSKCISYNKESNILVLAKCEDDNDNNNNDNNIIVSNSINNLYLKNK